jgi:pilus assembly protein CpaB
MATVAQRIPNPERTNRWLLIGAAALALLAGVLVFAALNATSGDDNKSSSSAVAGDRTVLVAKDTIAPNTRITADMFEETKVGADALVVGAITDPTAAIGKVARTQILKGEQLSTARVAASTAANAKDDLSFRDTVPPGMRGLTIKVDETKGVAGLLVAGDRVDIIATFKDKVGDTEFAHVETILQNVEVLSVEQEHLEPLASVDAQGTPIATNTSDGVLGDRPKDPKTGKSPSSVTLAVAPDEAQLILAAQAKAELTLVVRPPADSEIKELPATNAGEAGFYLPQPPRP